MMSRITVSLSTDERAALYRMAMAELRGMREQAQWLIHTELERRGWLAGSVDPQPCEISAPNTQPGIAAGEEGTR